jgi:hypothetical protein
MIIYFRIGFAIAKQQDCLPLATYQQKEHFLQKVLRKHLHPYSSANVPFVSVAYRSCINDRSVLSLDKTPSLSNMVLLAALTQLHI